MISSNILTGVWVAALGTTVVPLVLVIILLVKKKISLIPCLLGFAGFFVAQPILRMTIMSLLSTQQWYVNFVSTVLGLIIVGGLTAGLFEETARLVGGKILKNRNSYGDSISFGLGHGICEVLFLGLSNISNAVLLTMISAGVITKNQGALAEQLFDTLVTTFSNTPASHFYLGLAERIFAVTFHVAMTVLIFYGIRKGKSIRCYCIAILGHTILNSGSVLLMQTANVWLSEGFALMIAILSLLLIFKLKPKLVLSEPIIQPTQTVENTTQDHFERI